MKQNKFASAFVTALWAIAVVVMLFMAGCYYMSSTNPIIAPAGGGTMTLEEARAIAEGSECTEKGALTPNSNYNDYTGTWWIDLEMRPEFANDMCSPACVVTESTKAAEINWRCTGALPNS